MPKHESQEAQHPAPAVLPCCDLLHAAFWYLFPWLTDVGVGKEFKYLVGKLFEMSSMVGITCSSLIMLIFLLSVLNILDEI